MTASLAAALRRTQRLAQLAQSRVAHVATRATYGRRDARRGVPLVRIVCKACGTKAGSAEWRGRHERLTIVAGGRRYHHAGALACDRCGPLDVTWEQVEEKAAEAVTPPVDEDKVRPVSLHARPRSMP